MNGVLTLRRVGLRAQVRQRGFVAEGAEAVADTLRDVHSTAVHLIEAYPLPLPEGRRAGAEGHDALPVPLGNVPTRRVRVIGAPPLPLPEGRGAGAEVHDDIEHGAAD